MTIFSRVFSSPGDLNHHIFVTGVTGAGKTTSCQTILTKFNIPFWVIEPVKTEYRKLIKNYSELYVFTLGNENIAPFRLNPFELYPNESLSIHIDQLKATFTAAYPMEAAMPQLLEEAIYATYKEYGWDWHDNSNRYYEKPWESDGACWPTINDLLSQLKKAIESKGFGQELKGNYMGALLARFQSLTLGTRGLILNCRLSTNLKNLIHKNVVFEMDNLPDSADKALMMGLLLVRLKSLVKEAYENEKEFQHITLIEEAHRLLAKVDTMEVGSGTRKQAIHLFTDMLAEVRKYGEGIIIVDQIPSKLTTEVMKNTNTKIIHRLFARDDREAIGDTVGLNDTQKEFLTRLESGNAIVYSADWQKAAHVNFDAVLKTRENF